MSKKKQRLSNKRKIENKYHSDKGGLFLWGGEMYRGQPFAPEYYRIELQTGRTIETNPTTGQKRYV